MLMDNDSLNDLKKKCVQILVKTCIKVKLSAEFNPATRRFYGKLLEALRLCFLAWEKRYFPFTLAIARIS